MTTALEYGRTGRQREALRVVFPSVHQGTHALLALSTAAATQAPTATPQVVHYPPKTRADLRDLAAKGDANAPNLKRTFTLDIGGILSSQQEYVVTY